MMSGIRLCAPAWCIVPKLHYRFFISFGVGLMSFRLPKLFLFSFLVALACAAWTTWDGAVESYERETPFRLSFFGAIHFFMLFAAPTAAIGCWLGMAGRAFLVGCGLALACLLAAA